MTPGRFAGSAIRSGTDALRSLTRTPFATSVAIASLALGLGSLVGVYSTFDWLLNRPPDGIRRPDEVIVVQTADPRLPGVTQSLSFDQFVALQGTHPSFGQIATFTKQVSVIASPEATDQIVVDFVSGDYFSVLGVEPYRGRMLAVGDQHQGSPIPIVLSHAYWRRSFAGAADVLGRVVRLGGNVAVVVGVAPPGFDSLSVDVNGPTDAWLPLTAVPAMGYRLLTTLRNQPSFPVVVRLNGEATPASAVAEIQSVLPRLPAARKTGTFVQTLVVYTPARQARLAHPQSSATFFRPLLMVCGLVLLAACFNLSEFVVRRVHGRRTELAIKAALGASASRLIRQVAVEAALLGAVSLGVAALVASGVIYALSVASALYIQVPVMAAPVSTMAALNGRMLCAVAGVGVLCLLIFGVGPAVPVLVRGPSRQLRWGSTSPRSRHIVTAREMAIIGESALTVVLATIAALHALSFMNVARVQPEYPQADHVLLARLNLTAIKSDDRPPVYDRLMPTLLTHPEVVDATIGWNPPHYVGRNLIWAPGHEETGRMAGITAGAARFFQAQGLPLLAGREFDGSASDERGSIIINAPAARSLWPGLTDFPLGKSMFVRLGTPTPRTIVGIAADDRCDDLLESDRLCAWLPFTHTEQLGYLRVRTRTTPAEFVPALHSLIRIVHPDAAVSQETPVDSYLAGLTAPHRAAMLGASGLASFALLLVVVAIATVFTGSVHERRRDLALRLALGAPPARLARAVLGRAFAVSAVGAALGAVLAWRLSEVIVPQLHRVDPHDLRTLAVPLTIVAMSTMAAGRAAILAARTDPAQPLKSAAMG